MTGDVRWAIVGAGSISEKVGPDLAACDGAEVVAVFSRNREKAAAFAARHDIARVFDDYAELLADPVVDAVYIATPIALHDRMCRAALLSGKHVLVEKPMATNADEVTELFELAAARGLFLMEGMWMKFNPALRRVQEEIRAGRIGTVRSVHASFGFPIPEDGGSKWDLARSGGALLDQGIYPVTVAHVILGEPESVYARGDLRDDGLDRSSHFTLEYSDARHAGGATSIVEFLQPTATITGTGGWITMTAPFWASSGLRIHADSWHRILDEPEHVELGRDGNGYVPMARAATAAVREGLLEHPIHPAAATIAVFRTLDSIRASLAAGRTS